VNPPQGRPLALPTNIRLGWTGLPGRNTLAYYENLKITAVKSLIVKALGLCLETRVLLRRLTRLKKWQHFRLPFAHAIFFYFHLNTQYKNMVCCRYFKVCRELG
jgi:hypothetical protein